MNDTYAGDNDNSFDRHNSKPIIGAILREVRTRANIY
jgi:hypothetical protein